MSIALTSSDKALSAQLSANAADGSLSPVELQALRDGADEHVFAATGLDTKNSATALGAGVVNFLSQADGLVETMQRIALDARKGKLPDSNRAALKAAIEHQIAYVVAGYQSSIERL